MVRRQIRRVAAALLAATGALHLVLAPEYLQEKAYIGVLFILGGLASLAVAGRLWTHNDRQAWALGALTAAGMAGGFILSRSIGLPGFHETDWELSGLVSVLLEAGFLGALVWHKRAADISTWGPSRLGMTSRYAPAEGARRGGSVGPRAGGCLTGGASAPDDRGGLARVAARAGGADRHLVGAVEVGYRAPDPEAGAARARARAAAPDDAPLVHEHDAPALAARGRCRSSNSTRIAPSFARSRSCDVRARPQRR